MPVAYLADPVETSSWARLGQATCTLHMKSCPDQPERKRMYQYIREAKSLLSWYIYCATNFCGTQVVKQIKQSLTRHIINEQKTQITGGLAWITELSAEDICFSEWSFNEIRVGILCRKLEKFYCHLEKENAKILPSLSSTYSIWRLSTFPVENL